MLPAMSRLAAKMNLEFFFNLETIARCKAAHPFCSYFAVDSPRQHQQDQGEQTQGAESQPENHLQGREEQQTDRAEHSDAAPVATPRIRAQLVNQEQNWQKQ